MHDIAPKLFDLSALLEGAGEGRLSQTYAAGQAVFLQGEPADAVFYLQAGKVQLSLLSPGGREAVIGLLGTDDFFGEGCLAGQTVRMSTSMAIAPCAVMRVEKHAMIRALRVGPEFSAKFIAHLLYRNIRIEEDLIDQLFNSSEKRLARVLLLLANFGKEGLPQPEIEKISQQTLADMIGTTRSRVSFFMNKFRRLGFIEYNGALRVHVNSTLLHIVLQE